MEDHARDPKIEFSVRGDGVPILFVPGSYSTGAAWRGVEGHLPPGFQSITTALMGYGATEERRREGDLGIDHEISVIGHAAAQIGAPFHLVGHSFGGTVALAAALSRQLPLLSLSLFEPNPLDLIRQMGRKDLYDAVHAMAAAFKRAVQAGEKHAAGRIIDFWDGPGAYAALPAPVQAFCQTGVAANVWDWQTDFDFALHPGDLTALDLPVLLVRGGRCNEAMKVLCDGLEGHLPDARAHVVDSASHSLIQTHGEDCARLLSEFLTGLD